MQFDVLRGGEGFRHLIVVVIFSSKTWVVWLGRMSSWKFKVKKKRREIEIKKKKENVRKPKIDNDVDSKSCQCGWWPCGRHDFKMERGGWWVWRSNTVHEIYETQTPLTFPPTHRQHKRDLCFFLYLSSLSLLYQRIEISRKLITNWCVQQQKRLRIGGGRRWRRTIRSLGHGSDGWVKDGRGDTVQRLVDSLSLALSSQFCLMRFRGGPIGGICWVAKTRKASASRWGWDRIIDFQPAVSITSVACLKQRATN